MFRIVTDTSANLPTAYLQQEHITIIPFTFHADGDEQACLDLNTFDAKTFYAQMRSRTKVSTCGWPAKASASARGRASQSLHCQRPPTAR